MPAAGTAQAALTAKGRQTRAAIEQSARKLFAERGFHGTTLADITSAAGKSSAVFYRYFADKEDLLAALAKSFLHDVLSSARLSVQLPQSPEDSEFFDSVVTGYWNIFKQKGQRVLDMDFTLPEHLPPLLAEMDAVIERDIAPLQAENMQYFDHRREFARTDVDNDGIPTREWEDLLTEMRRRADKAGWLRYGLPAALGGRDGTNVDMAVIREHLAHKGLGLHNDLQNASSIAGHFPQVIMMERFGTDAQRAAWSEALITGQRSMAFGLTEPQHGSDATWLETHAR